MLVTDNSSYIELLQKFPPRPIKSEAQWLAAQDVIDDLLNDLDIEEITLEKRDYLNLLGILVHEYEEEHLLLPDLSGVELLKALVEEFNLRQKDLVAVFKTESIVSAVLSGQRKFTVEHIKKLADFFHISPAAFFPRSS
jgi:HTH-type transcriptional regulator / antitoxin HigA